MSYIDAHTHLNSDELYPHWQDYLHDFVAHGGTYLLNVGVNQLWNTRAVEIAQEASTHMGNSCVVKATVGVHPSEVSFGSIKTEKDIVDACHHLETLLAQAPEHILAIGECGIDAHYPGYTKTQEKLQQRLFSHQCALAKRHCLPVVIHSRDGYEATVDVLEEFRDIHIYMHCRGYAPDNIEDLISRFPHIWFGFCGNITYPKAEPLRQSLLTLVAHDAYRTGTTGFFVETDAPWLAPQQKRGQVNTPANIHLHYAFLASFLGLSGETLATRVYADRERFLGLF